MKTSRSSSVIDVVVARKFFKKFPLKRRTAKNKVPRPLLLLMYSTVVVVVVVVVVFQIVVVVDDDVVNYT